MKVLVCEICNGRDFVKQDGMYICRSCGTKYTVDEARNLMVDVPDNHAQMYNTAPVNDPRNNIPAQMYNYNPAPVNDPRNNFAPNQIDTKKKKRRKRLIITLSVVLAVLILLSAGGLVGYRIYDDYRKEQIIKNSAPDISNNTWKSLESGKTISLNPKGGTYGSYKVTTWNYDAPTLVINYKDPDSLDSSSSSYTDTLKLSFYQGDILQLKADDGNGECFVKESDYDKVKEIIKQSEIDAAKNADDEFTNSLVGKWEYSWYAGTIDKTCVVQFEFKENGDCARIDDNAIRETTKGVYIVDKDNKEIKVKFDDGKSTTLKYEVAGGKVITINYSGDTMIKTE